MTTNVIETNNLTVYYGRHRGIVDVDLAVEKGRCSASSAPTARARRPPSGS